MEICANNIMVTILAILTGTCSRIFPTLYNCSLKWNELPDIELPLEYVNDSQCAYSNIKKYFVWTFKWFWTMEYNVDHK